MSDELTGCADDQSQLGQAVGSIVGQRDALLDLLSEMVSAARQVLRLAPLGLPEDVSTLHGPEAAEELQGALDRLRNALAEYEA